MRNAECGLFRNPKSEIRNRRVGNFPFCGNKNSGIGREGLGYSIDEMTRIHTIVINMVPGALHKERQVLI